MILSLVLLALAGDLPLAGLRLDRAPSLGLGEPVPVAHTDAWKAAVPGGFATVSWWPTEAEAAAEAAFNLGMLRGQLPTLNLPGATVAHGDEGMVVARRENVVVIVRGDDAVARASTIVAAIEVTPTTAATPPGPVAGVEPRDAYGRRVER